MNEVQFAHRLRHHLNQAAQLDASTAARLRAAREQALSRYRPGEPEAVLVADHGGAALGGVRRLSVRVLLPVTVLCIAFVATYAWQKQQRAAEIEELDAKLLTGDLPIDAYLDQGFAAWLKRHASQ